MVRECTHILPSGRQCAQFALRCSPWCRSHMELDRREKSDAILSVVEGMPLLDLHGILETMGAVTDALIKKEIPPSHAQAVYVAALDRLEELHAQRRTA